MNDKTSKQKHYETTKRFPLFGSMDFFFFFGGGGKGAERNWSSTNWCTAPHNMYSFTYNSLNESQILGHHVFKVVGDEDPSHVHFDQIGSLAVIVEQILRRFVRDKQNRLESHLCGVRRKNFAMLITVHTIAKGHLQLPWQRRGIWASCPWSRPLWRRVARTSWWSPPACRSCWTCPSGSASVWTAPTWTSPSGRR